MEELFEKAPIPKAYFKLALPVVLSMVASMIYNLADTFFVSQTQNTNLVAGVALCTPLFSFLIAIGDIFGLGGSSLISRLLGEKAYKVGSRVSSFCLYGAVVLGLLTTVVLLAFSRPILHMLGATEATYPYAAQFYRIMAVGAMPIVVSIVPGNLIRTEGFALQSMIGTMIGTVITIILDPILIFPLGMGAAGAALATVIGYTVSALLLVYLTKKYCRVISIDVKLSRIEANLIRQVLFIGIPGSITNLMQAFGTAVLNRYLVEYGATRVAAMGIVLKVYMIIMLVMVGFAFGAQPLIGYTFGAKNMARFKKILHFDLLVEVGYALALAIVLMIFAPQIIGLFLHNPAVITAGTEMLRVFLSTTPFVGVVLVYTTVFQSTGKASGAFIMSIARQGVVFYLMILLGSWLWGYLGVIWAQPLADIITCLLGWLLARGLFNRKS
ncbi:MATE family efflux transporter [Levilactobacillus tujiorum]|uniref:Multidrug export protein MepA n=1 Tax=Levilactobacillus tujiorum TaxID=2912243 RepID=A0ABX1L4K3_9LACO|nr:MATE family efflux transporter [Levilactobacillus tujiorum]MCH5463788.1 MATE family efflux transporter [Levilactobacillus tujiorum]NLR10995.1 MATE family efflux transporter [Lactobacillus sp. HBUAS51387]NLR28807.1 MATE family efflux transporter [Levilactobacillus tujiorum]